MNTTTTFLNWLNEDADTVILQRDNTFAMLTWRDFNHQPAATLNLQTAAWLFILGAGIPLLMLA